MNHGSFYGTVEPLFDFSKESFRILAEVRKTIFIDSIELDDFSIAAIERQLTN